MTVRSTSPTPKPGSPAPLERLEAGRSTRPRIDYVDDNPTAGIVNDA